MTTCEEHKITCTNVEKWSVFTSKGLLPKFTTPHRPSSVCVRACVPVFFAHLILESFCKLPDITIKVNCFDDFNKGAHSFIKLTVHIT